MAENGDDQNPGTREKPWRSFARANRTVKPGDTVKVQPGHYEGAKLTAQGTAGAPITYVSVKLHQAVIDRGTMRAEAIGHRLVIGVSGGEGNYTVVDGFEVTGAQSGGLASYRSQGVVIRNCHSHHNRRWGIFTKEVTDMVLENNICHDQEREHGIYHADGSTNCKLIGNVCYGNGGCGIQLNQGHRAPYRNVLIDGNLLYDNNRRGGQSFNFDGATDVTLRNNVIIVNRRMGLALYQGNGDTPAMNNVIVNNTFINVGGRGCILLADATSRNVIFNNIFWSKDPAKPAFISEGGDVASQSIGYNAFTGAPFGQTPFALPGDLSRLFLAPGKNDFRLVAAAAVIGKGVREFKGKKAPEKDRVGNDRSTGTAPDIGAYEFKPM